MIYPEGDKIDKRIDSKYALVILAAKRAKLIKEGSSPLLNTTSTNPLTVALEEIANGKIGYQFDETSLAGQEAIADKQAVIGKRDIELEGVDPLATPDEHSAIAQAAALLGAEDYNIEEEDSETEGEESLLAGDDEEEEEDEILPLTDDTEDAEV